MGTLDDIALIQEVTGVAPGGTAELLQSGEARQHTALGVDGAAGEDIGDQGAVVALGLEGVEFGVGVHPGDLVHDRGQVRKGLQLGHHDADFLILGDVVGGVGGQELPGGVLVIALGGRGDGVGDGMEERIDAAPGDVAVRFKPLVDLGPGGHGIVGGGVGVTIGIEPEPQGDDRRRQGDAGNGLFHPAPGQEEQHRRIDQHQHRRQDDRPVDLDVLARHPGGLAEDQQVSGVDGIVAGHELPILGPGEEEAHAAAEKKCRPCPVQGRKEQQRQQHEGQDIQHQHHGLGQIPGEQVKTMVAGGEKQAQKSQAAAPQEQQKHAQKALHQGPGPLGFLFRHRVTSKSG